MQQRLKGLDEAARHADELSDPLEQQLALDACRAERRQLAAAAKGCADVGEKLNVVLDFLQGFQDDLAAIDGKLGALQGQVPSAFRRAGVRGHKPQRWKSSERGKESLRKSV